jgi:hypothetical protein
MNRKLFVFDIDGTLANLEHRRHWLDKDVHGKKQWGQFHAEVSKDTPYEDIIFLAQEFFQGQHKIVISSGRHDGIRKETEDWLEKHGVRYHALYMRKNGDYRPDNLVKVELLEQIRKDHGEPFVWFDDRDQVVKALRENGVRVVQVADGNF